MEGLSREILLQYTISPMRGIHTLFRNQPANFQIAPFPMPLLKCAWYHLTTFSIALKQFYARTHMTGNVPIAKRKPNSRLRYFTSQWRNVRHEHVLQSRIALSRHICLHPRSDFIAVRGLEIAEINSMKPPKYDFSITSQAYKL